MAWLASSAARDSRPRSAWTSVTVSLLLGVLLFAGLLAQLRPGRIAGLPAWVWLLSCLPLTWMSFESGRHVPILVLWYAPVLALLAEAELTVSDLTEILRQSQPRLSRNLRLLAEARLVEPPQSQSSS